jgi:hypothetical protein
VEASFMPRDSQGNYSPPNGTLVTAGQVIQVSQHNPFVSDVAAALSQSLSRTGLGGMQADLDLGGNALLNGRIDAATPNAGTTGGVRIRANATSDVAYLQVTSADGSFEYGYWRFSGNGVANWSGAGGLQVSGNSVWHTGNLTPANYALLSGASFSGAVSGLTPHIGTAGGVVVRGYPGGTESAFLQFTNSDGTLEFANVAASNEGRIDITAANGLYVNGVRIA